VCVCARVARSACRRPVRRPLFAPKRWLQMPRAQPVHSRTGSHTRTREITRDVCLCKMIMLLTSISCGAVKTTSAKWTQTKSTVIVKFPLRRGSTKCTDESARLEGDTPQLFFSTVCGADTYQLNVALAGGVTGEPALKPDSRRSEVVVTLTKAKAREAWKHLTAEPERYKALITRAPAPYESDEPLRPSSSSSGGGGGGGGTQSVGVGAHGETAPQSDTQRKMLLDVARARTEKGKVDGATLDKMRAAIKQNPEVRTAPPPAHCCGAAVLPTGARECTCEGSALTMMTFGSLGPVDPLCSNR
jgi:hypothetical protein